MKWRRIPFYDSLDLLNSNIRCIEMGNNDAAILASRGWIVTLDVLKLYAEENTKSDYCRWIVTLDVLKWEIVIV